MTNPPNTVLTADDRNQTAQSAQVCDRAGNCATGSVTGLNIDRTPPTVAVNGVAPERATYTIGAVPTPICTANDSLSGLTAACSGKATGAKSNGVGSITYTATAKDKAGNVTTATVHYRVVYRTTGSCNQSTTRR